MNDNLARPLRAMAEVALGRQRSPEHEAGPFMTRYLRAANVKDGVLVLDDVKEMNFTPHEREVFSLRPGDVLVTEGAGSLLAVGAAAVWKGELTRPICFQNTLLRLRPRQSVDARFLAWWCRYAYSSGLFASVAWGANIFHLSAERVRALPAWVPGSSEQLRIADFLDAETARIDALIETKRRMIATLAERFSSRVCERTLRGPRRLRLRRLFERATGGTWGDEPGAGGVDALCIRGTDFDMATLRVNPTRAPARSMPEHEFVHRRLSRSDIVIEKSGGGDQQPVGRAVLYDLDERAVPTNFAARLRPAQGETSAFLVYLLSACYETGATRAAIKQTTGIQNLDMDAFLATEITTCEKEEAETVARELDAEHRRIRALAVALERQIDLLREHRQALITAAVTGRLDVTKAAA